MKTLLALVLSLSFASFAQAKDNPEFARKAELLGKLAYGTTVHKVKAENAEEMIIKLAMKNKGETRDYIEENFRRNLPAKDIAFGDMIGWGTMKLPAAQTLFASQDAPRDENGEDLDNAKKIKLGQQLLKELAAMGATFGYTDYSSSYCGVSFMGLLIVDEENNSIYEIALTDSGSC